MPFSLSSFSVESSKSLCTSPELETAEIWNFDSDGSVMSTSPDSLAILMSARGGCE